MSILKTRYSRVLLLALALVLLFSLAACSGDGDTDTDTDADQAGGDDQPAANMSGGETINLTFSIGDPDTASKTVYYKNLAQETYEATNGAINITVHSGGTLFAHSEVYEGVLSGAADMGWFYTPWNPDQFPLTEVIGLPIQFGNQMAATYMLGQLIEQSPEIQEELSMFKVCHAYSGPTNIIYSSTPIYTPADMKGMQVRSFAGAATSLVAEWGASPLLIGATEIYDAMDKGTIGAFIYEWSGVNSNTLYEVINYVTNVPMVGNPFMCIMNQDSYDRIPDEYKDIFDELWCTPERGLDFAEMFAQETEDSRQKAIDEYGVQEIDPDDAQMAEFAVAADKYIEDWIATHTTDSFNAQDLLDLARELYAEGLALYPD